MLKRSAIASLLFLLPPIFARASTVIAVPESELTAMADAVVWARVVDVQPFIDPQNAIMTRVTLSVVEGLYGAAPGDELTLEVPGGRLASGLTSTVSGAPQFAPGEMVFAFLEKHGKAHHALGLSYGVLKGQKDANGRWRVNRNLGELTLVNRKGEAMAPASVSIQDELLDDLRARVVEHLKNAHGHGSGGRP